MSTRAAHAQSCTRAEPGRRKPVPPFSLNLTLSRLVSNAQLDVAFTDTHKMSEEAHLKMVRSLLSCRALHDSGEESPTFEDQAVVM